jgi:queuosine biosynthesis protein QueC
MQKSNFKCLIIGEVYTDVHLDLKNNPLRLGGIFHSARAFDSIGCEFGLAVISPRYLYGSVNKFGEALNASEISFIGEITGAPNVITIQESAENGEQGYNDILMEQAETEVNSEELELLINQYQPTDILIYPGKYEIENLFTVLKSFSGRIHIDIQYKVDDVYNMLKNNVDIETIILSTSSSLFKENKYSKDHLVFSSYLTKAKSILLKENRGGSSYYDVLLKEWIEAPAFRTDTIHSVGVGDCFNSYFLYHKHNQVSIENSLKAASYNSMLYASTLDYNEFKALSSYLDIKDVDTLIGNRISWEERNNKHIYIAGPDFPDVDTTLIKKLHENLLYHNFCPHRPIMENGLITGSESIKEQEDAFQADLALLEKSSLLIAVILNDDPGTYVEIGWMAKAGKPVIIFDPYKQVRNLFLKKSATHIAHSMNEVIDLVYEIYGQQKSSFVEEYNALLLASGGLDSTVLAYKLLSEGRKVLPVFLNYGQHFAHTEYSTLTKVLPNELVPHIKVVNIEDIFKNSKSRMIQEPNLWIDDVSADELYLPYRNLLFLSIAASMAQTLDIRNVYSAFINSNHAKEIDCSKEFFENLSEMLSEYGTVDVIIPFRDFSKSDVINLGLKLKVPIAETYSCQANSQTPCGVCPNCVDRINGFDQVTEANKK